MTFLSIAWPLTVFALTRVLPAAARVAWAVVVWLFTFVEAHHAAILAAISYMATLVIHADSWALGVAKAALAYFGSSAFVGVVHAVTGDLADVGGRYVIRPLVDIEGVVVDELARLQVAFRSIFPKSAAPVVPATPPAAVAKDGIGSLSAPPTYSPTCTDYPVS